MRPVAGRTEGRDPPGRGSPDRKYRELKRASETPTERIELGGRRYYRRDLLTLLPTMLNPFVVLASLGQIGGQLVVLARHSGNLPGLDERTQSVAYRLPFDGTWTVLNGGVERDRSHSWSMYTGATPTTS